MQARRDTLPVVDFGHVNCRELGAAFKTKDDYRRVFDRIGETLGDSYARDLHCHFSKIEYTDKGEKKHLTFKDDKFGPPYEPFAEAIAEYGLTPSHSMRVRRHAGRGCARAENAHRAVLGHKSIKRRGCTAKKYTSKR